MPYIPEAAIDVIQLIVLPVFASTISVALPPRIETDEIELESETDPLTATSPLTLGASLPIRVVTPTGLEKLITGSPVSTIIVNILEVVFPLASVAL